MAELNEPLLSADADERDTRRHIEVNLIADGTARPSYVGIEPDGTQVLLGPDPDEQARWLGLSPRAAGALINTLVDQAATEAVWAIPGDRVSASSRDLEPHDVERVIDVGPEPADGLVPAGQRTADAQTVSMGTDAQGRRVTLDMTRTQAAMSQLAAEQGERAVTSLEHSGAGHPSYGTTPRPDRPQPEQSGTGYQIT